MNVRKSLSLFCFLFLLSSVLFVKGVSATPVVAIMPDTILTTNETVYCNGTGFETNSSVRIDLVYPSGTIVEGVASSTSDANGSFTTSFTCPNLEGYGYVKARCGNDTISTIVTFISTVTISLDVSYDDDIYANSTTNFYINEQSLNDKNYIIDAIVINPGNIETKSYHVLHSGVCTIPLVFSMPGNHFLNFSVENARYLWSHNVTVQNGTSQGSGGTGTSTNITWTKIQNKNTFTITVFKTDYGYIQSGSIVVIDPDGRMYNVSIMSGVATFDAELKGTHRMQFNDGSALFIDTFDYLPTASLSLTPFTDDGLTTISLKIDGEVPDEDIEISVISATGSNTVTVSDGMATFTATSVGVYTFKLDYKGITSQITASYTETYSVEDFSVIASEDGSAISVSGKVVGDKTGNGLSDARVSITCSELGYSTTIKTTSTGIFRATIVVPSGAGGGLSGKPVVVSYEYGDDGQSSTVILKSDWVGGLWWLWLLIAFGIFMFLWKSGTLYKYLHIFPPKGKVSAPKDDGIWDDAFS